MMTVLEYAEDVNKSVEEVLELCEKLSISKSAEEDLLDQDEITMLDSEIANANSEEEKAEEGRGKKTCHRGGYQKERTGYGQVGLDDQSPDGKKRGDL